MNVVFTTENPDRNADRPYVKASLRTNGNAATLIVGDMQPIIGIITDDGSWVDWRPTDPPIFALDDATALIREAHGYGEGLGLPDDYPKE